MNQENLIRLKDFSSDLGSTLKTLMRIPFMWRPADKFPPSHHQEAVILGNGPSLRNFLPNHQDFLKNKDVWAVNLFSTTPWFEKIKPAKYVVSAPEYWLDEVEEDFQKWRTDLFSSLAEKTRWPMDFFIPVAAKGKGDWQKMLDNNKHIRIIFYNTMPVEGFKWFRYALYDRKFGMPRPHNVMIPSLMNAILSGYEKIYVTGIDHDWLQYLSVQEDNTVYLIQKHFYDEEGNLKPAVMKKMGKGQRKMHEILEKFYYSFRAYHEIAAYSTHKNTRIYNITPGSMVDAFERMKLK